MAPEDSVAKVPRDLSDFVRLPKRADARRSFELLLASAAEQFAIHGPLAPLDEIARGAGVGNATLYRHFPTRQELIVAVSAREVEILCRKGDELASSERPGEAVVQWLRYLLALVTSKRGLAAAILTGQVEGSSIVSSLFASIEATASRLLNPAKAAGAFRSDLRSTDVVKLITAVAFATETDAAEESDRFLTLVLDGIRPDDPTPLDEER